MSKFNGGDRVRDRDLGDGTVVSIWNYAEPGYLRVRFDRWYFDSKVHEDVLEPTPAQVVRAHDRYLGSGTNVGTAKTAMTVEGGGITIGLLIRQKEAEGRAFEAGKAAGIEVGKEQARPYWEAVVAKAREEALPTRETLVLQHEDRVAREKELRAEGYAEGHKAAVSERGRFVAEQRREAANLALRFGRERGAAEACTAIIDVIRRALPDLLVNQQKGELLGNQQRSDYVAGNEARNFGGHGH